MLNTDTLISSGAGLIGPGEEQYDAARAAFNLASGQRPAGVCLATEVEHI